MKPVNPAGPKLRWFAVAAATSLATLFLHCGGTESPPTPADGGDPLRLVAVLYELPWAERVDKAMREKAREHDVELVTVYHRNELVREGELVRQHLEGFDGLIIAAQDPDASVTAIKAAHDAGLFVFCVGTCLNREDTQKYVDGFYESDPSLMGYRTGAHLAQWLAERRRHASSFEDLDSPETLPLGILHCDKFPAGLARSQAFRAALKDHGVRWQEMANREGYLKQSAKEVAMEMLQEFENIQVLWAANEGGTAGAVEAVRELERAGQVFVFGTDYHNELETMLLDSDDVLQAVTGQEPEEIGRQAMDNALAAIRGDAVAHYRSTPTPFYVRSSAGMGMGEEPEP